MTKCNLGWEEFNFRLHSTSQSIVREVGTEVEAMEDIGYWFAPYGLLSMLSSMIKDHILISIINQNNTLQVPLEADLMKVLFSV